MLAAGACSSATMSQGVGAGPGEQGAVMKSAADRDSSVKDYLALKLKLAECYRQHGLENAQDPDDLGGIGGLTVGDPALESAFQACRSVSQQVAKLGMPSTIKKKLLDQEAARMTPAEKMFEVRFAKCMQANGFPDYPDPLPNGLAATPDWAKPGAKTEPPDGVGGAAEKCNTKLGFGPPPGAPTN